jgi:hypothetical protein
LTLFPYTPLFRSDANFTNSNDDKLENITNESIGDLSDVDITTSAPTEGQALIWDSANSKFIPGDVSTGEELTGTVTSINDSGDPDTINLSVYGGLQAGDEIVFSGTSVSGSGLTAGVTYYINAAQPGGNFEITDTQYGMPITLTDTMEYSDFNFTAYPTGAGALGDLADVNVMSATEGQALVYNSASSEWQAQTITSGITQVSEDTTPTLGGNLDVNGNSIVSTSDGNITIAPNGTGKVVLSGIEYPTTNGTNGQILTTNGSGIASWEDAAGGGSTVGNFFFFNYLGGSVSNLASGASNSIGDVLSPDYATIPENLVIRTANNRTFKFTSTGQYMLDFSALFGRASVTNAIELRLRNLTQSTWITRYNDSEIVASKKFPNTGTVTLVGNNYVRNFEITSVTDSFQFQVFNDSGSTVSSLGIEGLVKLLRIK